MWHWSQFINPPHKHFSQGWLPESDAASEGAQDKWSRSLKSWRLNVGEKGAGKSAALRRTWSSTKCWGDFTCCSSAKSALLCSTPQLHNLFNSGFILPYLVDLAGRTWNDPDLRHRGGSTHDLHRWRRDNTANTPQAAERHRLPAALPGGVIWRPGRQRRSPL